MRKLVGGKGIINLNCTIAEHFDKFNYMKVVGYKLTGNSFPIIAQDEATKYFVKLRAGMSGEYGLLSEWLGNTIGRKIGVNARRPIWFSLSDSWHYDEVFIEVRDLIEKSMGFNIGFEYISGAKDCPLKELDDVKRECLNDVFLLDVLMLNIDRTSANPNLLKDTKGNLVISDFESSLLLPDLLNNGKASYNLRVLQCLKLNPFFQDVSQRELCVFIDKLNALDWTKLLDELPDEVLTPVKKEQLQAAIDKRRLCDWGLRDLLERIASISLETTEEKAARIKNNREKLEELVRSTQNEPKLRESR